VTEEDSPAERIDTSRPHPARMYDYYLGGRDNYEIDREAAERVIASSPRTRESARANRAFMLRAVRAVVGEHGIRQIIDVGTGIPTSPNTHEVAQAVAPETRVVYVDNDPIVSVHAAARLTGTGRTSFLLADVRRPEEILAHPELKAAVDFDRPVALILVALLHFINDREGPGRIVATLRDALPSGSFLVLSHCTRETMIDDPADVFRVYESATASLTLRSKAEISAYFDGFSMLEPGLVTPAEWRPDADVHDHRRFGFYCGVARKP
jgi:S-adenosyl methyltransferase